MFNYDRWLNDNNAYLLFTDGPLPPEPYSDFQENKDREESSEKESKE